MVNLRYHIVSLVAVFLALAVGIVVGSTVVDRAIVNSLNDRLDAVEARANATSAENRRLASELDRLRDFSEEARDTMVSGILEGKRVLIVTVQGVDRDPVDDLLAGLEEAAAQAVGTLSLTTELLLASDAAVRSLAAVLDVPATLPDTLRRQAFARVAAILAGARSEPALLPALANAGFVTFQAAPRARAAAGPPTTATLASLATEKLRVVVVSGAGAQVPDQVGARALTAALAEAAGPAPVVVAAEVASTVPESPATFLGPLRADATLAARVSTVDHVASPVGQAAVLLALRDLDAARTGHYGVGPGAQRQLPALAA